MKKNIIRGILVIVIVLAVFNMLAFLIPFVHTNSFWISYIFITIAILIQCPILFLAFRDPPLRSRFYGFPVARVGFMYLLIQLLVGVLGMIFAEWLPQIPVIVVSVILLAATVIGVIATDAVRDQVITIENKTEKNTATMRNLWIKAQGISVRFKNTDIGKFMERLSEDIRYSDPVSNPATEDLETRIDILLDQIRDAACDSQFSTAISLCSTASEMLKERNNICRATK